VRSVCTKIDDVLYNRLAGKCREDGYESIYDCVRSVIRRYAGEETVYTRIARLEKRVERLEAVVKKIVDILRSQSLY